MRSLDELLSTKPGAAALLGALLDSGGPRMGPRVAQEHKNAELFGELLGDIIVTGLLLSAIDAKPDRAKTEPEPQERITPFDAKEPPFFLFWQKLNAERAARGEPEAGYATARTEFLGGPTPLGAMTFVGKDWNGIRAVPSEPITSLGGKRPSYHGEFRSVSDNGTHWHKVKDAMGQPIKYPIPEAALIGARGERNETVPPGHR